MSEITTLVDDIYKVLSGGIDYDPREVLNKAKIGEQFGSLLEGRLHSERETDTGNGSRRGTLRASNIGVPCERQLWYRVNDPDGGEDLLPHTYLKFVYGDVVELLLLELARVAGHVVEGEQTELSVDDVKGHRDAVIDGMVVDVKSASSYSFNRFKQHLTPEHDKFGYLTQLGFYLLASQEDPVVTVKDKAAFLAVDKTTGEICLDVHDFSAEFLEDVRTTVQSRVVSSNASELPDRGFSDVPDGKSGNMVLDTNCSYCAYKWKCWDHLSLYAYAGGPRYFTQVVKEPNVPLIKQKGF